MKIDKLKLLETVLILGSIYFFVAAIAHFFGLTIFPFYEGRLFTAYHDSLIAMASIVIAGFLFAAAMHPKKDIDIINIAILSGTVGVIFNIWILWRIDFIALGAPDKRIQTIAELVMLTIFVVLLLILKPRKRKNSK